MQKVSSRTRLVCHDEILMLFPSVAILFIYRAKTKPIPTRTLSLKFADTLPLLYEFPPHINAAHNAAMPPATAQSGFNIPSAPEWAVAVAEVEVEEPAVNGRLAAEKKNSWTKIRAMLARTARARCRMARSRTWRRGR